MKKYISIILLVCLLITAGQAVLSDEIEAPELLLKEDYQESKDNDFDSGDIRNNEIIIKVKNETAFYEISGELQPMQLFGATEAVPYSDTMVVDITGQDMTDILDDLNSNSDVIYAQPNYKVRVSSVDERLWAVQNIGQTVDASMGTEGIDVDLLEAWTTTKGSANVVVGVMDTGIDLNHESLSANIWVNSSEIPNNGIDDDENGYIDDINGWDFFNDDNTIFDNASEDEHGTHMAGTISGNYGIAPNVKIMPLKCFSGNYGYTSDILNAIEYAEKMGIKIINCSFASDEYNYALANAMNESSMFFVCAAGNFARSTKELFSFPACYNFSNTISVSAADNKGMLSPISTYGKYIDIAAPGIGIYSTLPNNQYGYKNGTSSAAAHVSGAAALLLSIDEELTAKQLKEKLIEGATIDIVSPEETVEPEKMLNVNSALQYEFPLEEDILKPVDSEIIDISEYESQRQYPFEFSEISGNLSLSIYNDNAYDSLSVKLADNENNEMYSILDTEGETEFIIEDAEIDEEYYFSIIFRTGNHVLCYIGTLGIFYDEENNLYVDIYDVTKQEYDEPTDNEDGDFQLMAAGYIRESADFGNTLTNPQAIQDDYDIFGKLNPSGDVDSFVITFNSTGVVNFFLSNIPAGCKYKFKLYNSSKVLVDTSQSVLEHEKLQYIPLTAGTYFIQVYSTSGYSSSEYIFRAKWYPKANGTEPNESFAAATSKGSVSTAEANINTPDDVDFYTFSLSGNNLVTINLLRPSNAMYLMKVYRGKGDSYEITGKSVLTLTDQNFSAELGTGTYYVKIYPVADANGMNYYSADNYRLTINSGLYANLTYNTTNGGITLGNSEIKYFKFSSATAFGLSFNLSNIGTSKFNLYLYKYENNAAYTLMYSSVNKMNHSYSAGNYVLGIVKSSGTAGSFDIKNRYSNIDKKAAYSVETLDREMNVGDPPRAMECGFTNEGYLVWSKSAGFAMSSENDAGLFTDFIHNLLPNNTYEYGDEVIFTVNLRAPNITTPRTYSIKFRMSQWGLPFDSGLAQSVTVNPNIEALQVNENKTISGVDKKLYKVNLTVGVNYVFRTLYNSKYCNTYLRLYNSAMTTTLFTNNDPYGGRVGLSDYAKLECSVPTTGEYFIEVTEFDDDLVHCILTLETYTDTAISPGDNPTISGKYEGYYKIEPAVTKTYVISTTQNGSNCDTYLILLNSSKQVVTTNNNSDTHYAKITYTLSGNTTYYIRATNANYITEGLNSYTNCKLSVTEKSVTEVSDITKKATVNITSPTNNELIKEEMGNSINIRGTTANTDYVNITVNGISIEQPKGSPFISSFIPAETGLHTIVVTGEATYGGTNPSQTIIVNIVLNDDSDEPRGATQITLGQEKVHAISYIGDIDYFRFNPFDDITYTFKFSGLPSLKAELYMQDDDGVLKLAGVSDNIGILAELCENGVAYFVKVYSSDNSMGSYTMKVTTSYIDKYEPNNSFEKAPDIVLKEHYPEPGYLDGYILETISATMHTKSDVDYYKIIIPNELAVKSYNAGYLSLEISIDAPESYDFAVYKSNRQLFDVVVNNYSGNYKLISLPMEAAEYYVRAYPRNAEFSSNQPYTIGIQTYKSQQRGGEAFGWAIQKAHHVAVESDVIKYKFEDRCLNETFINGYTYADIVREAANNWNDLEIDGAPDIIFDESDDSDFTVKLVDTPNVNSIASAGHEGLLIFTFNFNNNILANTGTPMNISAHDMGVSTIMHELGHMLGLSDIYMYEINETDRNNYFLEKGEKVNYLYTNGSRINNRHNLMCGSGPHQDITVNTKPDGSLKYVSANDILGVRKAQGWDSGIGLFSLSGSSVKLFLNNPDENDGDY